MQQQRPAERRQEEGFREDFELDVGRISFGIECYGNGTGTGTGGWGSDSSSGAAAAVELACAFEQA
jgi:hypothetical protein